MKKSADIVTKQFLEEKLLDLREDLRDEISINGDRLDEKNRGYRDQILTGLDKVVKELETTREENTIGGHHVNEKLDDHERRITKLETPAS